MVILNSGLTFEGDHILQWRETTSISWCSSFYALSFLTKLGWKPITRWL